MEINKNLKTKLARGAVLNKGDGRFDTKAFTWSGRAVIIST